MSDSAASPGQYTQKGRLEIMLDEFSELHGTVLMGMHRELQTLKQEVQSEVDARLKDTRSGVDTQLKNACRSVESQLKEFLSQYAPAEDRLATTVSEAHNRDRELRALVNSAQAYQSDLTTLQAKGIALGKQQQAELAQTSTRLLQEFSHTGQQETSRLIEEGRKNLESTKVSLQKMQGDAMGKLHEFSQTGQQETARLIEEGRKSLDSNKDSLQKMLNEAMGKMEAIQKVAKSVLGEAREANEKSNELLALLRKEQATHDAEVDSFNKVRLRITTGLGAALIATVGIWIWLTATY